jgi:hypothetical protein
MHEWFGPYGRLSLRFWLRLPGVASISVPPLCLLCVCIFFCLFFKVHILTASSILSMMGVVLAIMHDASLDVVQKALAILKFVILCALMYTLLLHVCFIASIQTGAPYSSKGGMAPSYIIFRTSCRSPHVILADFDMLYINLMHFFSCVSYMLSKFEFSIHNYTQVFYFIHLFQTFVVQIYINFFPFFSLPSGH